MWNLVIPSIFVLILLIKTSMNYAFGIMAGLLRFLSSKFLTFGLSTFKLKGVYF